jgi:hypothetical protein
VHVESSAERLRAENKKALTFAIFFSIDDRSFGCITIINISRLSLSAIAVLTL